MKKLFVLLSVLALSVSIVGCKKKDTPAESSEKAVFVIGAQNPETGQYAVYGSSTVAGAKLAIDEANANGGINGMQVELLNYDSRGEKTEAVNLTKRLLNADVCAIIGEVTSGAYLAMRDTADRGSTIAFSTGATAKGVTERVVDGKSEHVPFAFRNTLQDSDGAPALVNYVIDTKGAKNFAIITSVNNDYSVGLSNFFRDAINASGATIVAEQSISDGDTDVSAQITSLKNKNIDVVVYTGYYQEAALILIELAKQGINAPLIGGDGFQSPELTNLAKEAALGAMFFSAFAPTIPTEKVQNFRKSIEAKGVPADSFSAHGYDGARTLMLAIEMSGVKGCGTPEERGKIRDALATIQGFDGITGTTSFDAMGSAVKEPVILEVVKTSEGTLDAVAVNK